MSQLIMAQTNGRVVGGKDKVFEISGKAKAAIAKYGKEPVSNATIGAIMDDDCNLVVLSSVLEVLRNLAPEDFAEYAPPAGVPTYLEYAKQAVFGKFRPEAYIEAAAAPGGTGALRNAVSLYTCPGDVITTADWNWGPYKTLCQEQGRSLETYNYFAEDGSFDLASFNAKMTDILSRQPRFMVFLNTPAHNPTGYCLSSKDWDGVLASTLEAAKDPEKKIVLVLDIAYIDFCKDPENERAFFKRFENLPENVLVLVAFSMSKSYTVYGMRGGALLCISSSKAVADEFATVAAFASRGTWSNCNRSAMTILTRIYEDPQLKARVDAEQAEIRDMLLRRGDAFVQAAQEADLKMTPFSAGFFCVIPCENPDAVCEELQKDNIFVLALAKGLRVSIASVSEAKCAAMPAKIKAAIKKING